MARKSISKEYLLTDNSVNVYGFRMLTEGFLMDMYARNPIGYRMHDRDGGVVVSWENLRIDGDKVYGTPAINLANPIGERTADEVENGFLNAASCGTIKVLEYSEDPELMLPGQTGPTITKWVPKEISLVDVPGNEGALAQLCDKDDNPINLADFVHSTLKKIPLPGLFSGSTTTDLNNLDMSFKNSVITTLNLSDNTDDAAAILAVQNLAAKAAKADQLSLENVNLKRDKEKAESDLQNLQAETVKGQVKDLLDKALNTDKKITVALHTKLADDYKTNPEGLKDLLAAMPAFKSVVDDTENQGEKIPAEYLGKDLMALHSSNQLEAVKAKYPDLYTRLKTEHDQKKKGK